MSSSAPTGAGQRGAPAIVRGSLLTMDPGRPRAEALALAGGRIVAVGSFEEVRRAVGERASVEDLRGATLLPGLIDAHNHMLWTGLERRLVDLRGSRDVADVLDRVARWSAAHRDAPWIASGEGWHVDDLAERRYPTREELDSVVADRPVFLGRGGHAAAVNSRALELGGIGPDTPDPPGGVIERGSETGAPSGVLVEGPARELVACHMPPPSRAECLAALREIQGAYLAAGLTRVQEPGLEPGELGAYQALHEAGELTVRVTAMPALGQTERPEERLGGLRTLGVRTGFGDARLRLGGAKLYFDGAASFGTAYLREDWPGRPGYRGELVTSAERLEQVARFCAAERWSLGVHVVGGGGLDLAIEAFRRVDREHPIGDLGFTLIHAYLWPSPDNMRRARELGLVIAAQPTMQERFAPVLERQFGWQRVAQATPLRSWRAAGVTLVGGSDSPITPYEPLRGIWQAATRYSSDLDRTLGRDECLTVDEALEIYTRAAARACFCPPGDEGVLRPGARADWIALDADPLEVEPAALRDLTVLATASDGEIVHDAR